MKKLSLLVLIATMSMAGGALADQKVPKNRFQTISYQVSQEQLVTSQTAKVSVLLNATVPSAVLAFALRHLFDKRYCSIHVHFITHA